MRTTSISSDPDDYPVSVTNPGVLVRHGVEHDLHGFEPERARPEHPRRRLALRIIAALVGLLIAVATALLFVRLVRFAQEDLPAHSMAPIISSAAPTAAGGS